MEKPTTFRPTKALKQKMKELQEFGKKQEENPYPTNSAIIRAGIMQLYKQRILNKDKFFGGLF